MNISAQCCYKIREALPLNNDMVLNSFYDASARNRILGLLDKDSFKEFLLPNLCMQSPHLAQLNMTPTLDDGVIIGQGHIDNKSVLIASQEGQFLGGSVGEIHGAKLVGLLKHALQIKPDGVLLLLDSGGVRLHEANAGLIAISEIVRALIEVRTAGIPVVVLIGGSTGCFGGMGIAARCSDYIIMSEEGRLALSGPEVIETVRGVEEFDSRDRALVWRTTGGKHRYILGECDVLVDDSIPEFRKAITKVLNNKQGSDDLESLIDAQNQLEKRTALYGQCHDALDIWREKNIESPQSLPLLETEDFLSLVNGK